MFPLAEIMMTFTYKYLLLENMKLSSLLFASAGYTTQFFIFWAGTQWHLWLRLFGNIRWTGVGECRQSCKISFAAIL